MQDDKTDRLIFTSPSGEEEQTIQKGLAEYIPVDSASQLLMEQHLVIGKGRRQEVFLLSPTLWKLYRQVHPNHPYFIGLFLGELKDGIFEPSLHILHRLADAVKSSAKVVALSKGEQRFLYGHNLKSKEVQSDIHDMAVEKKVLVVNQQTEGLGYGFLMKTRTRENVVKNRLDLGWYLRRGR